MRSKESAMELSEESFIETYGNHAVGGKTTTLMVMTSQANTSECKSTEKTGNEITINKATVRTEPKIRGGNMTSNAKSEATEPTEPTESKSQDKMKRRLRRISVDKLSSLGEVFSAAISRRRKSVASDQPSLNQFNERKNEWKIPSWVSPYPNRKPSFAPSISMSTDDGETDLSSKGSDVAFSPTTPEPNSTQSSPLHTSCVHQGYLDLRNRKKRWEKYWCVLRDGCLHCYFTPQSDKKRDAVPLLGYDVIANVKNLNRARFIFHLQQQGYPNIYFSCDNHRDFLMWIGCLEKQITREKRSRSIPDDITITSVEIPDEISDEAFKKYSLRKHRASLPNIRSNPTVRKDFLKQNTGNVQKKLDQEFVTRQKQKLLNDLAHQKKELLEEQRMLDALPLLSKTEKLKRSPYSKRVSKDQVLEDYEKRKIQEEMRAKNFQTFLNCRRNSCHIKMSHINKNMSPSLGQTKRENLAMLAEMEKKLKETKVALGLIDRELEEGNAAMQHNLDRLQRKRDLELLIIEQQDEMQNMRRWHPKDARHHRRRSFDMSLSNKDNDLCFLPNDVTTTSSKRLLSERSLETDNTNFLPGTIPDALKSSSSNKEKSRFYVGDDDVTTDEDSGFQASNERLEGDIDPLYHHSSLKNSVSDSSKQSSDVDGLQVSISSLDLEDCSVQSRSQSSPKVSEEIDLSILAKIEDFELFARMKLQQNRRKEEFMKMNETKI